MWKYYFYTTRENKAIITTDYKLSKEEAIKLEFKDNKYQSFNCTIYFRYTVTEADYSEHQQYYIHSYQTNSSHDFAEDFYNHKTNYEGKESYYRIIFGYEEPNLTTIIEKEIASSEEITTNIKNTEEIKSIVTYKKTEKFKCELMQCLSCSLESFEKNLCTECDTEKGYYPIYDNSSYNIYPYFKCSQYQEGYFFEKDISVYKPCYIS